MHADSLSVSPSGEADRGIFLLAPSFRPVSTSAAGDFDRCCDDIVSLGLLGLGLNCPEWTGVDAV